MDLGKIFSMFTDASESVVSPYAKEIDSIKKHPAFHLGMFHKIINRENDIHLQMVIQSLDVDEETKKNIGEMSTYLTFTQAYNYLTLIDLDNTTHVNYLTICENADFLEAAAKALEYFESTEEFEKCGFIKKVIDLTIQ
jgi:hypothetical protein